MHPELNTQEIINYYDHCQVDYELVWHLKTKMCMHYGYWDDTTSTLREALVNMNKRVAAFAQVQKGDYVLDAGCGVGGSSIFLAKTLNCITKGITLSEKQVNTCRDNAAKHNVTHQCTFEVQNYLATDFADNTFDIVWAIESVCYAFDKADWKSVGAYDKTNRTRQYAAANPLSAVSNKEVDKKLETEFPKIYFFIMFLICCGYLWFENKIL